MAKKELPTLKDVSRVPEELRPVVIWWQDHGTKALTWAIVVVAVCVAAYLWHADSRATDAAAAVALASPNEVDVQSMIDEAPDSKPILQQVQARSLYLSGNYEGAATAYNEAREVLTEDIDLKAIPEVGRIYTLTEQGRLDEALSIANALEPTLTGGETPHYLLSGFLFAKANLLCKQGDKAGAKAALQPILDAPVESPLAKYTARAELWMQIIDAYDPANPRFSSIVPALPALPAQPAPAAAPAAPVAPAVPATPAAPAAETPAPAPEAK